jgi:metal-responsive CopG/Arc/MetJ family transcriptional regulator
MKVMAFSLPQQLLDLLEEVRIKTGLSRSDIIRRALEMYIKSL